MNFKEAITMLKQERLARIPEYWIDKYQDELYRALKEYMNINKLNQTELANKLNFSKSYISQVLKGSFNHSLKKFIELSIAVDRAPEIELSKLEDYVNNKMELIQLQNTDNVINFRPFYSILSDSFAEDVVDSSQPGKLTYTY